jgi:hypothetical protein
VPLSAASIQEKVQKLIDPDAYNLLGYKSDALILWRILTI